MQTGSSTCRCASSRFGLFSHEFAALDLKPLDLRHREALLAAAEDPTVRAAICIPGPAAAWVARVLDRALRGWNAGVRYDFAAENERGDLLGCVSIWRIEMDTGGRVELGYWTAQSQRNQGHATSAGRRACSFAFDVLRTREIVARSVRDNGASVRVLAKLGFNPKGAAERFALDPRSGTHVAT